jgi:hypothetical protein
MSVKTFTLAYVPLVALGLLGLWLGFNNHAQSDFKLWLSLFLTISAAISLFVVFRRDLLAPESEQKAEWKRIQAKGKFHFVLSRTGLPVLVWILFLLMSVLSDLYWEGETWETLLHRVGIHAVMIVLMGGFSCAWALFGWYRQEKKYGKAAA